MTKLGTCTITVEPHIFEAQMWAIKDPTPRTPVPPAPQQQPMYRPIIQYGPPNGVMPPPRPPPNHPPLQQMHQAPRPQDTPMANTNSPHGTHPANGPAPYAAPNQAPLSTPNPPPSNPPPADSTKRTDPVIQMLAEQAATDPDLKALMKTVANGEASPTELKLFQSHIDHLTRLHKQRQAAAERRVESSPQQHNGNENSTYANATPNDAAHQPADRRSGPSPPQHGPTPSTAANGNAHPSPSPAPNQAPIPATGFVPAPAPLAGPAPYGHAPAPGLGLVPKHDPHYQSHPQPQALRSKGPVASSKPDISGIVFDFSGGSGDRFLFPKFSILEYLPHGQVIASFLIVRKGSASDSPAYDPELDYYQPITIRLYAHQGRQLDALQKVVAPPDEVRRYMDDIMDNMTRAEYVLLAMRLPRDEAAPAAAAREAKEVELNKPIRMDDQVLWTTTNPTPAPVPVQPAPRLLTEEEKYQSFISTVTQKV